jgi:LmbE family N-acetylglucosaminyl deacetylase
MFAMTNLYSELDSHNKQLPRPDRVLTIGAHPDDAEFGAGGTLAKWASDGTHVTMLVISDGSKGTWDPSIGHEELVALRAAEQRAAATSLGAEEIVMLEHTDGELVNSLELRTELCYWIRSTRPDVIFTHDPWKKYMLHPDHRAAGMAAIDAIVAARDHLFFPEQLTGELEKYRPSAVCLWSADELDHWEDITQSFDTKVEALLEHSTQGPTTMGDAQTDGEASAAFVGRLRSRAADMGMTPKFALAEAFKRITP